MVKEKSTLKTIVIIDDNVEDLEFMKEAIQQIDPSIFCICFVFSDEAMKLLKEGLIPDPHLIFIDLKMPRLDGHACLAELRALPRFEDIPVIMYSGSMTDVDSQKLLRAGAAHTFNKPNGYIQYLSLVQRALLFTRMEPATA